MADIFVLFDAYNMDHIILCSTAFNEPSQVRKYMLEIPVRFFLFKV